MNVFSLENLGSDVNSAVSHFDRPYIYSSSLLCNRIIKKSCVCVFFKINDIDFQSLQLVQLVV